MPAARMFLMPLWSNPTQTLVNSVYAGSKLFYVECIATYRGGNKGLYVVARNFFLLLLNCSACSCLGHA